MARVWEDLVAFSIRRSAQELEEGILGGLDWKSVVVLTVQHENGNGCPRDEGNDIPPGDPPGYDDRDLDAALDRAKIRRHEGSVAESHIGKIIGVDIGTGLEEIDGTT